MFYVDYKDRIWAYYHLDNIAEMDDVYGATWLRGERERLQVTRPKAGPRAGAKSEDGESAAARDRPFSVVDMAYRRMTLDPWTPLPDDSPFQTLIACGSLNYPYSSKMWRRTSGNRRSGGAASAADGPNSKPRSSGDADDSQRRQSVGPRGSEASGTSSDNSMPAHLQHANANVTGSYHLSFLPGPYMCPVWSDINSVDLYDLGACNLLELVMPELLAVKHVFCKALDINPDSIDDTTSLATVPGLANWVRSHLYAA
ncbi:hypothetical protein LPJ61_006926 [Coemansia biformis]|uniref:Uncharacterized protein n=1 Tax=Coemansia biformis TaxID=1286918 RepID=A0A9W8CNG3_9FUNG|nr:hypothetical protein LPJ61_006926 [Coemansia biformis]